MMMLSAGMAAAAAFAHAHAARLTPALAVAEPLLLRACRAERAPSLRSRAIVLLNRVLLARSESTRSPKSSARPRSSAACVV